jgi:hypothetical protein
MSTSCVYCCGQSLPSSFQVTVAVLTDRLVGQVTVSGEFVPECMVTPQDFGDCS